MNIGFDSSHRGTSACPIEPIDARSLARCDRPIEHVPTYGERTANRALKAETRVARMRYRQMAKADV